jgi:hypothetical protein
MLFTLCFCTTVLNVRTDLSSIPNTDEVAAFNTHVGNILASCACGGPFNVTFTVVSGPPLNRVLRGYIDLSTGNSNCNTLWQSAYTSDNLNYPAFAFSYAYDFPDILHNATAIGYDENTDILCTQQKHYCQLA